MENPLHNLTVAHAGALSGNLRVGLGIFLSGLIHLCLLALLGLFLNS